MSLSKARKRKREESQRLTLRMRQRRKSREDGQIKNSDIDNDIIGVQTTRPNVVAGGEIKTGPWAG